MAKHPEVETLLSSIETRTQIVDPTLSCCSDGRYGFDHESANGIAMLSAHFVVVPALLALNEQYSWGMDGASAFYTTRRAVENNGWMFCAHTDEHESHTGKWGCSHIFHGITDSRSYGLNGQHLHDSLNALKDNAAMGSVRVTRLRGNHEERIVVINEGQRQTIATYIDDGPMVFLYDKRLAERAIAQIAQQLLQDDFLSKRLIPRELQAVIDAQRAVTLGKLAHGYPVVKINADKFHSGLHPKRIF